MLAGSTPAQRLFPAGASCHAPILPGSGRHPATRAAAGRRSGESPILLPERVVPLNFQEKMPRTGLSEVLPADTAV